MINLKDLKPRTIVTVCLLCERNDGLLIDSQVHWEQKSDMSKATTPLVNRIFTFCHKTWLYVAFKWFVLLLSWWLYRSGRGGEGVLEQKAEKW